MTERKFSYDSLPYPSYTFPKTSPDRLSTAGAFYGMETAKPENCRVLELGCGDGTNLMYFAGMFPESEFVGIDLSQSHIDQATETRSKLELVNIKFLQVDITKLSVNTFGKFDFIIAHGIFSWVPDFVRAKILALYRECLNPQGVGYISYNVYPGWKIGEIARDAMRFHVHGIAEPMEKVRHGLSFLSFTRLMAEKDSTYQRVLAEELEQAVEKRPENVFHDELAEVNQPFYFYEFASLLQDAGLQFVSEADPSEAHLSDFGEDQDVLGIVGADIVRREQYVDFIKCRKFRSSLVCHAEIALDRKPSLEIVDHFRICSSFSPKSKSPNMANDDQETFIDNQGSTFETNHPLTKAALAHLSSIWAQTVTFQELELAATGMLADHGVIADRSDTERLRSFLITLFKSGFVKFQRFRPRYSTQAGEFPEADKFACWQIARGCRAISTAAALSIAPEFEAVRLLITLLDGTRDRNALFSAMKEMITVPDNEQAAFEQQLPAMIEENLATFAKIGLLIN